MKSFLELKEKIQKGKDDPCWKDYVQLGTKKKNGKEVPNCVPKESAVQEESTELDETITPKHVKMAIGVASDKRYAGGNMTGAVNAIEKIKKGLSDHPQVKAVLRKQNESLDEAGSPERLAMIKRATQRVKDKRDAARAAEKKTSFKAAARDMQTKGAQRGMAPLKRDIDEGRGDARKALMGLVKQGGIDKATFQKAYDLYSDTKFVELKKLISGADTDPREAILDVINRHDRKTFNSMYPRGLSKGGLTKESVELGEATDFRPGDTVHEVGSKLKGTVQHKGNRDLIAVKFGSVNQMIPASRLRLAEESELDEVKMKNSEAAQKLKNEIQTLERSISKLTPLAQKATPASDGANMRLISAKSRLKKKQERYNQLMKESVGLGEAKISVGDRVTLQPNKNTLDRSLIGKAGVVTGMVGSKPTVKFANGKTIVASPNDLKINESSELDEAKNYEYKDGKVHISKANFRKVSRDYKNPTKGKESMVVLDPKTQGTVLAPVVFTEESSELDEATYKTYMVTIVKGTFGGVKSDGRPTLVKAKSVRDATTKAAKKVKIDPRLVPTGGFDVKINSKESVELDESKSKKYYNDLMKSALKKAGRKMDPDLTSSFATNGDFVVSDRGVVVARLKKGTYPTMKESVEHENCGTPDCCGGCETDIKETNFFQFRNRLDSTRD